MLGESSLQRSREKGFTLVELLVIVVIIGALAAIAIPAYTGYINKARLAVAYSALETLRTTIEAFHVEHGEYPAPPVGFTTTGFDDNGHRVLLPLLVAQIREDLFAIDSYILAGDTWTLTARANDDQHTLFTLTQQGITR